MTIEQRTVWRIDQIRHDLSILREIDADFEVFGSERHRYQSTPVTEEQVREIESLLGLALPLEYRLFIKHIGCGAGPYYGLHAPGLIVERAKEWQHTGEIEARAGRPYGPGRPDIPFPATAAEAVESMRRYPTYGPYVPVPDGTNGIVFACDQGCSYSSFLVTAGELEGVVFDYSADSCDAFPANEPPTLNHRRCAPRIMDLKRLPTFLDWIEMWIHRIFRDFAWSYGKGIGRPIPPTPDKPPPYGAPGAKWFPEGRGPRSSLWRAIARIFRGSGSETKR